MTDESIDKETLDKLLFGWNLNGKKYVKLKSVLKN